MGYIKKTDYIEKFGVEAWKEYLKTRKAPRNKWRANNKDHVREYHKEYCENHREAINSINRKSYYKNHELNLEASREYYNNTRKDNTEYQKRKYQRSKELNPDYSRDRYIKGGGREYSKKYRKTTNGRASAMANSYKRDDKDRGFDTSNNITTKWIVENIFNSECIYCGDSDWTHLGADRIDNSKPHTPDNVVCSCGLCNMERQDKYSVEEFKEYRNLHPRVLKDQKSWEIIEMNGIKVLKKKDAKLFLRLSKKY